MGGMVEVSELEFKTTLNDMVKSLMGTVDSTAKVMEGGKMARSAVLTTQAWGPQLESQNQ